MESKKFSGKFVLVGLFLAFATFIFSMVTGEVPPPMQALALLATIYATAATACFFLLSGPEESFSS